MDLEEQFRQSTSLIMTKESSTTDEDLLLLYGLYKQSTQGNCVNMPEPWHCQLTEHARWKAWYDNYGMERTVAMQKYIDKVNELMELKIGIL